MRFPFTHCITRGDDEIELTGIYDVTPFIAATYWQPAEGGEVEIISVKCGGEPFDLTDAEEATILETLHEQAGEDVAEERAAAEDWRAQERRDRLMMDQWENGK